MDGLVSRCSLIIFTFWSSCSTKAGTAGAASRGVISEENAPAALLLVLLLFLIKILNREQRFTHG